MVVPIRLTEEGRHKLGIIACILCAILCFAGVLVICLGVFVQISINNRLILLESFNSGVLPNLLVSIGTFVLLLNAAVAKISLDCSYAETNEKYRMAMVPILAVISLVSILILSGSIVCFKHRSAIEKGLHHGLMDAMKRYKDTKALKIAMDKLQMLTKCCGSRKFTDWFTVGWINKKYVDPKDPLRRNARGDNILVQSVPFSCCNVHVKRPCVHHYVNDISRHRNYKKKTLYTDGCTGKLMDEIENKILVPVGVFVQAVFYAQLGVIILLRYVQTSVQDAFLEGDSAGIGSGYLLPVACFNKFRAGDPDKFVKKGALQKMRGEPVPDEDDVEGGGEVGEESKDEEDEQQEEGQEGDEGGEGDEEGEGEGGGGDKDKDKKQKNKQSGGKSKGGKKSKGRPKKKSKPKKKAKSGGKKKGGKKKGKKKR